MAERNQQNSRTRNNNNTLYLTFGGLRKPKEPQARNIVIDIAEPDFLSDDTKRRILVTVVVVVVAVAVALGVTLSQNSGSDNNDPIPVVNETTASTEGPTKSPNVHTTIPTTRRPTTPTASANPSRITFTPTSIPNTARPTTSARPTSLAIVNQFLAGLPAYSMDLAERDADSPQAKALTWLENDPQYNDYELYRLNQRYAMAVFYYSTNGASWDHSSRWMSDDDECTWYQYDDPGLQDDNSCMEASRLSALSVNGNDLDGTIPTELELLADLEYMVLRAPALSGTIHSEL
jgi:hypothetical protein